MAKPKHYDTKILFLIRKKDKEIIEQASKKRGVKLSEFIITTAVLEAKKQIAMNGERIILKK